MQTMDQLDSMPDAADNHATDNEGADNAPCGDQESPEGVNAAPVAGTFIQSAATETL
jgi:hypothetical protein